MPSAQKKAVEEFKPFTGKDAEIFNKLYSEDSQKLSPQVRQFKNALYVFLNVQEKMEAFAKNPETPKAKVMEAKDSMDKAWENLKISAIRNVSYIIEAARPYDGEEKNLDKKVAKRIVFDNVFSIRWTDGVPNVLMLMSPGLEMTFSIGCGYHLEIYGKTTGSIDMKKPIIKVEK